MEEKINNPFFGPENIKNTNLSNALLFTFMVVFTIWCVRYHWNRRRLYQSAAQRKGPPTWPIFGNGLSLMGSSEDNVTSVFSMIDTYESPFPIWLGPRLFFFIAEPEQLEIIMNSQHALNKSEVYKFLDVVFGSGLITAPVNQWKKHRKIIASTFKQQKLNGFVECFAQQSEILTKQLMKFSEKGYFDVFHHIDRTMVDVLCESIMGVNANSQPADYAYCINRGTEIIFRRMSCVWYHFDFIFNLTSMSKEFKKLCDKVLNFTASVVKQQSDAYLEKLKENSEYVKDNYVENIHEKNTFIQQLIELSDGKIHFTTQELSDEVTNLLLAGSGTTAVTISYVLVMLGLYPDIQKKVFEELVDVLGFDQQVKYNDLTKLKYTEMVINETMRIFPATPLVGRSITGDIKLDNFTLPADSQAFLGILFVHRNPKVWPDPLKFDPLRFLPKECTKRHPFSFVSFSGGPRNCIGLKYAMMSIKSVLTAVVRKYKITTSYKSIEEIRLQVDVVLKPVNGYNIGLELRNYYK